MFGCCIYIGKYKRERIELKQLKTGMAVNNSMKTIICSFDFQMCVQNTVLGFFWMFTCIMEFKINSAFITLSQHLYYTIVYFVLEFLSLIFQNNYVSREFLIQPIDATMKAL